ncbi:uncharacterized protein PpBr36_10519 [Pyricularia pennisetigena]|uniref:uncharacterized protein n=1 Tax=Pyricularia pennisetigena TaxID=1578925 RepID=UPI00115106CA|nr:uncharacterized protein PpBr36_10519 [Pyricularia pennisetigena]TLS21129.1 hypothetical protein PpBr36_10519 [Pyricularia pennisetigena]
MLRNSILVCLWQAANFYCCVATINLPRKEGSAQAFASSADGKLKFTKIDAPVLGPGNPGSGATWNLTMDDGTTGAKQTITGFGGSVTDATVAAYNMLPDDKKAELLRKLMTGDGANFSLIRHSIGSSDLSPAPEYTYADNNGQEDLELRSFQLGKSGTAMVSMLKEMKALQPSMILIGTSWAPPAWMQLDRKLVGTTEKNNLDHKYEAQFGQLFVKYLQAYKNGGVDVDAITIQNEPLNSNAGMPSLYVFPEESGKLIKDQVGPAIRKGGFNTQVWAYDHNTDRPDYPQTVLDIAREFVPAVAWHCYAPGENWSALTTFHKRNPSVKQFQTECWTSAKQTKWNQASWFTMGPLQNWASGSMAWTLGTDNQDGPHLPFEGSCGTCTGLFTVDKNSKTYSLRTDYYMIGQYSRYIPRNAVVHVVTGSYSWPDDTGVESVATVNPDGTRTVVIENKLKNDVHITLKTAKSSQVWSGKVSAKSYKYDTDVVATWLATTARNLGYIAGQSRRVSFPSSFATAIDRAVHARSGFQTLLSKNGHITDEAADSRHSHFADILDAVRELLRPLISPSVHVMTGPCRSLSSKKLCYSNSFTPLTVYDTPDVDETADGNIVAQPVYEAERQDTFEDACWAFSILLHDFIALRMQVKNLWERYARGELHLGSVAIATNVAIQIARSLEEDVEHLFAAHGGVHVIQKQWYEILCDEAGRDPRPEPGEVLNWEAYHLADHCFIPANLIVAAFSDAYALGKMHNYNGDHGWYDELVAAAANDSKTQFMQGKAALSEILMETKLVFQVLSEKETVHCRDEFSLAILAMLDCTRPSTIDATVEFRGEMRIHSWLAEDEIVLQRLAALCHIWRSDPTARFKRKHRIRMRPNVFLKRHHLFCGTWLNSQLADFHFVGVAYASAWGSLAYMAQLVHALEAEGLLPADKRWEDLDAARHLQPRSSFFVGSPPRDVEAHFRNHALMMGCSLTNFARNRRAKKTDLRSKGSPRGLRIGAPITRFTGDLFRGIGARGGLSVEQVEQILSKGADRAKSGTDGQRQQPKDGDGSCKPATLVLHLAMALEAEIPEATLNYFTVYRTTWQALRDLWDDNALYFDKVFGELEVLRDKSRGPSLVTFILMAATGRNDWVALGRDLKLPLELSAQSVRKMLDKGVGGLATAELERLGIKIDGLRKA